MSGVGVFGGTFNPIHLGHLRAAEEVAETLGLGRVLFVPCGDPPHKQALGDELAPGPLRLEWIRLAIEGRPGFEADPVEVEREGISYTVETLRALRAREAPERPVFLIGQDAFAEMGSWREPREVVRLADLAVMTRPPVSSGDLHGWLPAALREDVEVDAEGLTARHRSAGTRIRVVPITALDISASSLRDRLRSGASTRYLLPEAVRRAVEASGAFGDAASRDSSSPGSASGSPGPSGELCE